MKNILCLLVMLIAGFQFSACAQESDAQGKLVIIGGGSRPAAMIDRIIKESGIDKEGYGIILPMSSVEPDSAVYYTKMQFTKVGINNVHGLQFAKGERLGSAKLDSIKNAKLIYISGGDQNRFMDIVAGTTAEKAIHQAYENGSLLAGTSAGAAVMSEMMITGNELKHPEYASTFRNIESENIELKTGLGMLNNVLIDQHFVKRSRYNRLISAVIEHPELMGIGIDESTAILVIGKSAEVIGESQVIVFENPNRSKTEKNGKLGAQGLALNIYLPGDRFTLK